MKEGNEWFTMFATFTGTMEGELSKLLGNKQTVFIKKEQGAEIKTLTAAELSQQFYITPQYLSRLFRRFLGYSVYEYLTMYRISKAKEFLLMHWNLDLQEIALRVGFQDSSHFIVMFKKITGTTPLEFRKNN